MPTICYELGNYYLILTNIVLNVPVSMPDVWWQCQMFCGGLPGCCQRPQRLYLREQFTNISRRSPPDLSHSASWRPSGLPTTVVHKRSTMYQWVISSAMLAWFTRQSDFLCLFLVSNLTPRKWKHLLRRATRDEILSIVEVAANVLAGVIQVPE